MDIIKLIQNISSIIIYIAPGMMFLAIFKFITNIKSMKENAYVIWSVVISFIVVSLFKFFSGITDTIIIAGFSIIISILLSIILGYICIHRNFQKFLVWSGINKTMHYSMWDEIMDDYDVYLKLFIPSDKVYYYGLYKGHDENPENTENPYILLTNYEVRDYDNKLLRDYTNNRTRWATINTRDISSTEIIYSEKSDRNIKIIK